MSGYRISRRILTAEERELVKSGERSDRANTIALFVLVGFATTVPAWFIGGWLFNDLGRSICTILGFVPLVMLAFAYLRGARRSNAINKDEVEDVTVEATRAVSLNLDDIIREPVLFIEIEGGKTLLLHGQWLWNPHVWGAEAKDDEAGAPETFNGMRAPHSFPNTRFTISRIAHDGHVLSISISGEYLAPTEVTMAPTPDFPPLPSQLLDGTIDEVLATTCVTVSQTL